MVQVGALNAYALPCSQFNGTLFLKTCSGTSVYQQQPVCTVFFTEGDLAARFRDNSMQTTYQGGPIYLGIAPAAISHSDAQGYFLACQSNIIRLQSMYLTTDSPDGFQTENLRQRIAGKAPSDAAGKNFMPFSFDSVRRRRKLSNEKPHRIF
jgi:hypothetical protein